MPEQIEIIDSAGDVAAIRSIAELASNAMTYDEWAISHRVQDSLLRAMGVVCKEMSRDSTYVHYKNGILTLDYPVDRTNHNRIVLGLDNRATFLGYDVSAEIGRRVTIPAHFASNDSEKNIETILVQTKNFAVEAQEQVW